MSLSIEQMFKQLTEVQSRIDEQTKSLNAELNHRKIVVKFCYSQGMSAIKIAEAIGCTRQRVYVLLEEIQMDEEE